MDMQMTLLRVHRITYGKEEGMLQGVVEFTGPRGKVELELDEQLSQEVVNLCSDGIVRMSREIAAELTAEIVEGTAALPAPDDPDDDPPPAANAVGGA